MARIPPIMTERARSLRRHGTEAERRLWPLLSPYRPKFTRQLVVGRYILDLACRKARIAIELDGAQHTGAVAYDAERTAFLEALGWRVLRFWNGDVLANTEGVAETILAAVDERYETHPRPLPCREGRRNEPAPRRPRTLA